MAQLAKALTQEARKSPRRFRVILRGDGFVVEGIEGAAERTGFYVVRTTVAANETIAGKLALFDLAAELRIADLLERRFVESGSLAVEETRPLADSEDDVASGLILFPME